MHRTMLLLVIVVSIAATLSRGYGQESAKSDSAPEVKPPTIDELLLFFPTKFPEGDWDPEGLQFQDVFFVAEDGTRLHGWYCPAPDPRAVVLVAHGNAGHVASRAPWLRYLQTKAKVSVFMFDYRGYGRSEGTPTVEGAIQDATAARARLCELATIKDSEMILMGESLGGAIMVELAAESPPRGLVLQSTFSALRDVADVHFPKLSWLVPRNKLIINNPSRRRALSRKGSSLMYGVLGTHDRTLEEAFRPIEAECRMLNWCIDLQSGPFCHPDYADEDHAEHLLHLFFPFSGGQPAWFRAGVLPAHADKLICDEWSYYLGFPGTEKTAERLQRELDDDVSPSRRLFSLLPRIEGFIYVVRVDSGWWEAYASSEGILDRVRQDWSGSRIEASHWWLPSSEFRRPDGV